MIRRALSTPLLRWALSSGGSPPVCLGCGRPVAEDDGITLHGLRFHRHCSGYRSRTRGA